ncbi:hypothetical protein CDO52_21025 [Nocardiopsis gilva YIM 90087]|uniref:Uncharacterized protein n=1 Tax=Nocardiopsis gilva YIM 90087 TaxID=1235441 RepID=A0A223SA00_9ACTN|nr:hypothetical protein [Nocardiopsis gilva]ASU84941.1 hypothetical protein CDO52_21025 [Nocardiopsis gilva YIM 90087]
MNTKPNSPDDTPREPEGHDDATSPAEETADTAADTTDRDADEAADHDANETVDEDALLAPPTAGLFSAETFAIASLLAIGGALIGTRLTEMLMNVSAADQSSAVTAMVLGDGGTALIGVLFGLLSLGLTTEYSRPWARWAAMAAVLVGVLFIAASAYVFTQVPAPAAVPGF